MKYVLLFMIVMLSKSMLNSVKVLFTSKKKNIEKSDDIVKQIEDALDEGGTGSDAMKVAMMILIGLVGSLSIGFYIMSAIYVGQIIFVALGALMILQNIKELGVLVKCVSDKSYRDIANGKIFRILGLGYKFYFIYYLIITWNM